MTHTSRQAFKLSVHVMGQGFKSIALLAVSLCVWGLKAFGTKNMILCSMIFIQLSSTIPSFNLGLYKKMEGVTAPKSEATIHESLLIGITCFFLTFNLEVNHICNMKCIKGRKSVKECKTSQQMRHLCAWALPTVNLLTFKRRI